MKCELCDKRKPKRYCPAKRTSICPVCCGEKRGVEINCPLDCQYYVEGTKTPSTKNDAPESKEGRGEELCAQSGALQAQS